MSTEPTVEYCDDLDAGIAECVSRGYRLDMIVPADSPTAAQLSLGGDSVRLVYTKTQEPRPASSDNWVTGRAGMEYRDLLPDRVGGRLIASHIRLTTGGPVPDYVHYHKVRFQMIYCQAGGVSVVYEGQGPPFWLMPGDCVLQPPEIRHRVLEALAGSEVIEVGVPAVHETWVDHEMRLPTRSFQPVKDFSGQRFTRHIAADAEWQTHPAEAGEVRRTDIQGATSGFADVSVWRGNAFSGDRAESRDTFIYLIRGSGTLKVNGVPSAISAGGAAFMAAGTEHLFSGRAEVLRVQFNSLTAS